jgi:hypothetical protein
MYYFNEPQSEIKTYDDCLIIAHTNLLMRIKNDRLKFEEIYEKFEEYYKDFLYRFESKFFVKLFTIKNTNGLVYYLVEDSVLNRRRYYEMVECFKSETQKMINKISRLKFA